MKLCPLGALIRGSYRRDYSSGSFLAKFNYLTWYKPIRVCVSSCKSGAFLGNGRANFLTLKVLWLIFMCSSSIESHLGFWPDMLRCQKKAHSRLGRSVWFLSFVQMSIFFFRRGTAGISHVRDTEVSISELKCVASQLGLIPRSVSFPSWVLGLALISNLICHAVYFFMTKL